MFNPKCPVSYRPPLPVACPMSEEIFWSGWPGRKVAASQPAMVWVRSMPTTNSLMGTGDAPAFRPEVSHAANEAVAALRGRLANLSDQIAHENARRDVPYIYLDPRKIPRSPDI